MLTSASLAVYLIELLKKALPNVEFSPKVLAALLVVANAVATLILAILGVEGNTFPTDWVGWAKTLLVAILGALVSSGLYVFGYLPFKGYAEAYKQYHNAKKSVAKKSK